MFKTLFSIMFSMMALLSGCAGNHSTAIPKLGAEEAMTSLGESYTKAYNDNDPRKIRSLFRLGKSGNAGLDQYVDFATFYIGVAKIVGVKTRNRKEATKLAKQESGAVFEWPDYDYQPQMFFEFTVEKQETQDDPSTIEATIWLPAAYKNQQAFFTAAKPSD